LSVYHTRVNPTSPESRREARPELPIATRPRVVVLGAGFGGLFATKALAKAPVDITLIDRHNYHLFQPLLYQVAAAGLPPSDIAWPIRAVLSKQRNVSVLLAEIERIDRAHRRVSFADGEVEYDYLVVATGARHSYFAHDEWRAHAPGLKSIDDATAIRRRILMAFERAEMTSDPADRRRLLQFVVVGGGPTGVELAGTLAELAHRTLAKDFRSIDPKDAKITIVEAGPNLLPALHPDLRAYAKRALERLGVDVRAGSSVVSCDAAGVALSSGERIEGATVIWAAGVKASAIVGSLDAQYDAAGRTIVESDLSLPGSRETFVIGDAALVRGIDGKPVPGIAPAAKQQGRYVARVIAARARGLEPPPPFRYRHAGNLATIGRQAAVIEFPRINLRGWLAWWIWGIAHIYFLVGVPSPLFVSLRWLWEYLTYGRGARLITGVEDAD
jgi:NADH:quinone reductase (non-electrogenic)